MSLKISIGCDHAGFSYKEKLVAKLKKAGHEVTDHGTYSADSTDYADFAHPTAQMVEDGNADFGILICGSGNGVNMTANKHKGIRSALCWNNDLAGLARQHNDANMICIPERFVSYRMASKMVDTFLTEEFEGGRHQRRVDKIPC